MDGLHLTTAHSSTDIRIFEKEARSLADSGFDVGIVAHSAPSKSRSGVEFYTLGEADSRKQRWKNIFETARIAKSINTEVYHIHDPELLPVGVYLSRVTDAAVVYDVHEDFGHIASMRDWIPSHLRPILSKTIPVFERTAASQFDAVVAVSDWIGEPFIGSVDRICTIHNFPRTGSISTVNSSVETNADCTLCYVGGLIDVRGIHRMLELLVYLTEIGIDAELWALGSWMPDADRDQAERYIAENNLGSRVMFPGHVDRDEMFRYLHSADIGLALLDTEHYTNGIPTKLFEYLYAGLPIVTTPIDAVEKFIPKQYRYIVPQGDTEATADAVERALETDYDAAEMRSLVEREYSWEAEAKKLIALYEDLLQ